MFHSACISLSQEFTDEFNECFVLESWNPSFFYALLKTNLEEGGLVKQVMFSLNQFYLANNDREDLMINETFPGATFPLEYAFGLPNVEEICFFLFQAWWGCMWLQCTVRMESHWSGIGPKSSPLTTYQKSPSTT